MTPIILLHSPQMGENIGSVARSMKNFGLSQLRLITPRDGWPNEKARETARNAADIIDGVEVYTSLAAALHDIHSVYATTARPRHMVKPVLPPEGIAARMVTDISAARRPALLFGPERTGLDNDSIALATAICSIPVSHAYPSLNLAQAVTVACYEWFKQKKEEPQAIAAPSPVATTQEVVGLLSHLEEALDHTRFFQEPDKKPVMIRNLQNIFTRCQLTEQETRTLRGVIRALSEKK